jgi:hypothetical protein
MRTEGKRESATQLLMTGAVCKLVDLSPSSLLYHVQCRRLTPVGVTTDGRRLFALGDVLAFIAERKLGRYSRRGRPRKKPENAASSNGAEVPVPKGPTRTGR